MFCSTLFHNIVSEKRYFILAMVTICVLPHPKVCTTGKLVCPDRPSLSECGCVNEWPCDGRVSGPGWVPPSTLQLLGQS